MNHEGTIHKTAELLSLGMTPAVILLGIWVIKEWFPDSWTSLWSKQKTALQWFVLGVALGFMGNVVDNIYWGIARTAHYLKAKSAPDWFESGVYFNIVFRQFLTMLAAYCHAHAVFSFDAEKAGRKVKKLNFYTILFLLLGVIYSVILYYLNPIT